MNELIKYFTNSLASKSLSLKKKGVLIEKPWALIGENDILEKLIFKRNNELLISKNGKVKMATWEYFPEAQALLIDRGDDKILLKKQFIDDNVLILNIDSTEDFFVLVNENEVPDLNIPRYLNSLKIKKNNIKEIALYNGLVVQIHQAPKTDYLEDFKYKTVEFRDKFYKAFTLSDNFYLTGDRCYTINIKNNRVQSFEKNCLIENENNQTLEIVGGDNNWLPQNINKIITIEGKAVPDSRILDGSNHVFEIRDGRIKSISYLRKYELKNGSQIEIEQDEASRITKGDKIIGAEPIFPLTDGAYKIKGRWLKIKIENNLIVLTHIRCLEFIRVCRYL